MSDPSNRVWVVNMTEDRWTMPPEKVPVSLTPAEAFAARMTVRDYAKLEHGRLHNQRIPELKRLWANWQASTVDNPDQPFTRRDMANLLTSLYGDLSAYSMNSQAQVFSGALYTAFEDMGGRLRD